MKLAEIRFHTPIEFEGADGRKHVAQRFLAKDHDLRFLDDLGCLYIDGWHVSTQGARWLPAKEPELPPGPPIVEMSREELREIYPDPRAEETDGGYQPGAPSGPAARRPKRR